MLGTKPSVWRSLGDMSKAEHIYNLTVFALSLSGLSAFPLWDCSLLLESGSSGSLFPVLSQLPAVFALHILVLALCSSVVWSQARQSSDVGHSVVAYQGLSKRWSGCAVGPHEDNIVWFCGSPAQPFQSLRRPFVLFFPVFSGGWRGRRKSCSLNL